MHEEFLAAMAAIEKEKGVKKEVLFEAIEAALVSAYKRNFNAAANVRVQLDRETGEIKVFTRLAVTNQTPQPQLEISLADAREINPEYEEGDVVEKEVTPKNFGRIAAQTAKQVVIQRIREAERELVFEEYIDREEDILTGIVQRFEQKNLIIDLGKAEAVLLPTEQMPSDEYKQGERLKAYITEVRKTTKGPQIFVSRTHPGLLKRLFELEVPEIYDGTVEIKSVAREAGFRSKLAVHSKNRDVDPVGACVGPKGARVQAIVNELRGEKIDIVKWDENPEIFVANALSPAKVVYVRLQPDHKVANVVVPDYQLSLAIGKEGQNARLAAKLTNWKIDINSESQVADRNPQPVDKREELLGNDEDIMDPEHTVPGIPDEMMEAEDIATGGEDEGDETP
jgi:transcription termination/antitermination protein NusA